jgi:hypothetical protein
VPRTHEWLLFIDETGDFDTGGECVSVVGWLVREREPTALDHALRKAIGLLLPAPAYPPHAALLNIPLAHVASFRLFGAAPTDSPAFGAVASEAWDRLVTCPHPAVRAFVRATDAAAMPAWDVCRAADQQWRVQEPALYAAVLGQRDTRVGRLATLLSCLAECYGPAQSWILTASMSAADHGSVAPPRDPYLELLELLFRRALALLRSGSPDVHVVKVFVAARWVWVERFRQRVNLRLDDVTGCVRRAERFPFRPPRDGRPDDHVRLVPFAVQSFDSRVHAGIAVADFAANRLRHPLARERSWPALRGQGAARVPLPIEARAEAEPDGDTLPAAALFGAAEAVIEQAFSTRQAIAGPVTSPAWGADQAELWVRAATRWT